jgi:hypothetical protein
MHHFFLICIQEQKNNSFKPYTGGPNFILHSLFTTNPNVMKSLLAAAFIGCTCVFAHAQQTEPQKDVPPASPTTEQVTPPDIPEPLFVISEGGIEREISKDELGKLNISQIASVEMLLDNDSTKEYGEKGVNGVMIISLRKDL